MIKINKNTKVKIISLLSAIALWMYVIAIVDPEDTRLIEDIPVTITNTEQLESKDLMIYQDEPLTCSMYVSGKLSNVKGIKREDIQVYGEISDPIEGKNVVYLRANMSDRVSHEFASSTIIVNLEKRIYKSVPLNINVPEEYKEDVESIQPSAKSIDVSGPREQVSNVKEIRGEINPESKTKDYTDKVKLYPIDKDGDIVEDITLEQEYLNVDVKIMFSKTVSVNAVFDNSDAEINYRVNPDKVIIKGKEDILSEISSIDTEVLSYNTFIDKNSIKAKIILPEGVTSEVSHVEIISVEDEVKDVTLSINKSDIQLINNDENISISDFNIPGTIEVIIKGYRGSSDITEEDINLYIDMNSTESSDGKYKIEYSANFEAQSIEIKPNIVVFAKE